MPEPTLEKAPLVGKGFCSDVYAWGTGRVLKLFHGWVVRETANREYAATRAVHAGGLPAPAAYELIEVEGRYGIVFERIDGVSLLGYTQARPWALFGAIRQFAELHVRIHQYTAPAGLPSLRERITARIEASDSPAADKQAARERLVACRTGQRSATVTSTRVTCWSPRAAPWSSTGVRPAAATRSATWPVRPG